MAILEQALYERDKKDHEIRTNKETIAFSDDVTKHRNRYLKMLEDGEELTEDTIEKDQEQMVKLYGKRSPKLDAIKQDINKNFFASKFVQKWNTESKIKFTT